MNLYKAMKCTNTQKFLSYSSETIPGVDSKLSPPGEAWVITMGQWLMRNARDEAVRRS